MVGISGWIGQLSCLTIFSTTLSVAAFLRMAGSSTLESTGSHARGVERRVPEMRRMLTDTLWHNAFLWCPLISTLAFISLRILAMCCAYKMRLFSEALEQFRWHGVPDDANDSCISPNTADVVETVWYCLRNTWITKYVTDLSLSCASKSSIATDNNCPK